MTPYPKKYYLTLTLATLLASTLSLLIFTPKFYKFDTTFTAQFEHTQLNSPPIHATNFPQNARAFYTKYQTLHGPHADLSSSETHRAIQWRILLPWLWYALALPFNTFLALPYLCLIITLIYIAHITHSRTHSLPIALLTLTLTTTTAIFFVPTQFLAYFDALTLLAILLATFSPSKLALPLTCLLAPWVDERFILNLPLILSARTYTLHLNTATPLKSLLADTLTASLASTPYCALRILELFQGTSTLTPYIQNELHQGFTPSLQLKGLWQSLRFAWAPAAASLILLKKHYSRPLYILLLATTTFTLTQALFIAGDYSRNAATLLTLTILGTTLLYKSIGPTKTILILSLITLLNFITPAYITFRDFDLPLHTLPQTLQEAQPIKKHTPSHYPSTPHPK